MVEYDAFDSDGINGLNLTLGETTLHDGIGESAGKCAVGGKGYKGILNNIIHTIEPVFFDTTTNSYSSYHSIDIFEGFEGFFQKAALGVKAVYNHASYDIRISFLSHQLEEIHLGSDAIVQIQEGFNNMKSLRVIDRVDIQASLTLPFFNDPNNTKSLQIRASEKCPSNSQRSNVGHSFNKRVGGITSNDGKLSTSGSIETNDRVHRQCGVCSRCGIYSEECNDSLLASNATIETDHCTCIAVIITSTSDSTATTVDVTASTARSSILEEEFVGYSTCLDTTCVPPVHVVTERPNTIDATFS